jgi:transposase
MEKRRRFAPEEKAKIVLEMLREERTVAEIAAEYEIHPTQLHKWKAEALDNLPALFTRGAGENEKMRKQHEKEKEQLTQSSRRERLAPVLSHHRTYRSVYGGSCHIPQQLVLIP